MQHPIRRHIRTDTDRHVNKYAGTSRSPILAAAVAVIALSGYMLRWQQEEKAVVRIYLVAAGWGATLPV
ncbi:Hypp3812 [Branchiostoma lanceolatum]|uniref:Hypp3812 protein n=1 Tax=Branchiostoma lanceolatum TaxID=7740 RepID=A0A8K0A4H9_BRALA|nr:Hypp3812 [Branchiostoma lanceolatum]